MAVKISRSYTKIGNYDGRGAETIAYGKIYDVRGRANKDVSLNEEELQYKH
jgi:hypothetical protein